MPVATYALTGDFQGLVGEVSSIRATVNTNSIDGGWVNDVDNTIVLGGTVLAVGADGKFTVTLPTSTGTGLQYQVTAEFTDGSRNRKVWESGWFSLTAAGDLADLANDSTLRITQTLGDQLAARIDGYQDHGDVSGVLTVDPAIGTHVLVATGSLLVTLDAAPDGRIVTLYVVSGASSVTVDGITGLTLTDGSFASFVRIRGAWVLASAGGATGPADTTPPSNVIGLTATGGSGSLSASWTASTDAESSVSYRYRYWLTSGGATGAWTTTTATSFTVASGVPAGAYTVQVYAYSAGGQQTTPTAATATVTAPAGWNAWDSIDFASATAGTYTSPKDFTTTGGRTLRATSGNPGESVVVVGGKVKAPYTQYGGIDLAFTTATPPNASRVSIPFELVGTDSSYGPAVRTVLGMTTGAVKVSAEWNWSSGTSRRLILSPDYGSGVVYTAGPGYTLSGSSVDGIAATGTLIAECVGQVLKVYIGTALIISADFTNHLYGGSPNGLVGEFRRAGASNDGAIFGITWETYS